MSIHKNQILQLRSEGKTYDEIKSILNCSKGTIAYHCGKGQKEKVRNRTTLRRKNPLLSKSETFQNRKVSKSIENRIDHFQRTRDEKYHRTVTFHWKDIISKYGTKTKCYLTGREIDLNNRDDYAFDHIVSVSKGGDNSLENLGITTRQANFAKCDMSVDEFIQLCKDVLTYRGYQIMAPARGADPLSPSLS